MQADFIKAEIDLASTRDAENIRRVPAYQPTSGLITGDSRSVVLASGDILAHTNT
jgi:hypothetical protein